MEYIPGYTILKNIASIPQATAKKPVYELFENSSSSSAPSTLSYIYDMIYGSSSSSSSNANSNARSNTRYASESNFPRWSAQLQYHRGDGVHLNGFLYTSVKDSSNINPVLSITDDFITVNSDFWSSRGLSSKVKQYNSDTDSSNVYPYNDIVDFDGMLYQCAAPGTGCTTDYTKPQWTKLSQDYIRPLSASNTSNAIRLSPVQEASIYGVLGIYSILNDLTIQDIPGERLSDTFWRCVKIYYPYVLNILIFILAVVFASFSANDLLHKHYLYRVLAFLYTFYYVNSQGILSFCIFAYYLVRSLGGSYFDMNPLKIYGILPIWEDPSYNSMSFVPTLLTYPLSLRQYIEEGKEIAKANRLASHGDVVKFLRDALHLQKPKNRRVLGEVLDPMNKGSGPAPAPEPKGPKAPTGGQGPTGGVPPAAGEGAPWLAKPTGVRSANGRLVEQPLPFASPPTAGSPGGPPP